VTWATTSTRTLVVTRELGGHEVSKPSMTDAVWRAERIGPTMMAAPHRGQAQVVAVSVVVVGAVASVDRCASCGVRFQRPWLAVMQRSRVRSFHSRNHPNRRDPVRTPPKPADTHFIVTPLNTP
jgi:hypothetical protein